LPPNVFILSDIGFTAKDDVEVVEGSFPRAADDEQAFPDEGFPVDGGDASRLLDPVLDADEVGVPRDLHVMTFHFSTSMIAVLYLFVYLYSSLVSTT